jgi:dTDP-glucose 4,6-dehydratase
LLRIALAARNGGLTVQGCVTPGTWAEATLRYTVGWQEEERLRVLISGVAGFIASHLAERLLAEGHQVLGLDNFLSGDARNLQTLLPHPQFSFQPQNVSEPFDVDGSFDAVLHLASPASPRDYLQAPIDTLLVGSAGTRNMLELARRSRARFLLSSTSECYGDPHVHPQTETYWGNVNPVGPRSCYDESKRFAEATTMAYHRSHGLETRIARIFNTYGPRMKLNDGRVVPAFLDQALQNKPITVFGDGTQTRSFCYVSDLVDGLLRLLHSDEIYPVNLGNPQEMTMLEFAEYIQRLTGTESPIEFHPLPEDDPKRRRPDISKARRLLGWEPKVPLEEGLRETIAYFRNLPATA